ncbi:MAG: Unknown protein [uncultured Sulfurovum sp.]|uniref:Uncharacterized protein n=1 Tax=uncultured Sulfurovum sp. TaxID=269237 RepID=A0A6S6THS7_9BACT|nr:MAG: Unknown protein [uncultured Sulfurovum sp.]
MYLKKPILLLFLSFPFFSFLQADTNTSIFDTYHDNLCKMLIDTSNSIDDYFIDGNISTSSNTYGEFSTSIAQESYLSFENDVRFRLRLNLPKIQKNLRLVFEDDSSDNLLYDGTQLNDQHLDTKEYFLRLEYLNYVKNTFNIRMGGGLKVRKRNLVPYLNVRARYEFYNEQKNKSELFNRFRYYSDGEIENNLELNSLYTISDDLYTLWTNTFYHTNRFPHETLASSITAVSIFTDKQHIRYGLGISSHVNKFQDLTVDYYYLHSAFHHLFYKDWAYYEISPSILQRKNNDFKTSYRLLVKFGIYFHKK